jgi:hypothetical protein
VNPRVRPGTDSPSTAIPSVGKDIAGLIINNTPKINKNMGKILNFFNFVPPSLIKNLILNT